MTFQKTAIVLTLHFLFLSPFSYAISPTACQTALLSLLTDEHQYQAPRPTSYRLLLSLYPELKPYTSTLKKFTHWGVAQSNHSNNGARTWEIRASYQKGPIQVELSKEGFDTEPLRISTSMQVKDDHDPRVMEFYFLLATTLSQAKMILGIGELEIFKTSWPIVTHFTGAPWEAGESPQRLGPTYGVHGPYAGQNELSLEYAETLISRLESGAYSGHLDWQPDGLSQDYIKVGNSFLLIRRVPSGIYTRPRLEVTQTGHLDLEFAGTLQTLLSRAFLGHEEFGLRSSHTGRYEDFQSQLIERLTLDGVSFASPLFDENGIFIPQDMGPPFYIDLPESVSENPVKWVKEQIAAVLSRFSLN